MKKIKQRIYAILQDLVANGTLNQVVLHYNKRLIDLDNIASYPCAVLPIGYTEASDFETNNDNLRTYVFEIMVIFKADDITEMTEIEELQTALLNAFDQDRSLVNGENSLGTDGTVLPTTSPALGLDDDKVTFTLSLRVSDIVQSS